MTLWAWQAGKGKAQRAHTELKTGVHADGPCKLYLGGTSKKSMETSEDWSNENKQMIFIQSL